MRTEKQATNIFYKTPGAEMGCMPEQISGNQGSVTVETTSVIPAAKYLARFYTVTGTRPSRYPKSTVIDIRVKGQ